MPRTFPSFPQQGRPPRDNRVWQARNGPREGRGARTTPGDSRKLVQLPPHGAAQGTIATAGTTTVASRLPRRGEEEPAAAGPLGAPARAHRPRMRAAHSAPTAPRLGNVQAPTHARCAQPRSPPPQRRRQPPAPVSHHVPGAQDNGAGPHVAAAATAGTVEAVPAPLERHGSSGDADLPPPGPPLALSSHFYSS